MPKHRDLLAAFVREFRTVGESQAIYGSNLRHVHRTAEEDEAAIDDVGMIDSVSKCVEPPLVIAHRSILRRLF